MQMISPSRCARALYFCVSFLAFDGAFAQHVEPVPGVDVYSDSVGAVPASFRVDESGSATYTLPLVVPPGSGGVSPKLALAYDARAGWGAMGVGWQLSGLSSISRCKKTIEAGDGVTRDAIAFDTPLAQQAFCLDGQRLIEQGSDLGACPRLGSGVGQMFGLELDTVTRVCGYRASGASGFDRWLVYGGDGSIRRYGVTGNSTLAPIDGDGAITPGHVLRYAMDRLMDANGHAIDFEYARNNALGELNLLTVRYTGKGSLTNPFDTSTSRAFFARMDFVYDNLPNDAQRLDYVAGAPIALRQRLMRIDVFGPQNHDAIDSEVLIRRYQLHYEQAATGARSMRLLAVQECGEGGVTCYPPTRFSWLAATGAGFQNTSTASATYSRNLNYAVDFKVGDFNGDGRQDLVWIKDRSCSGNGNIHNTTKEETPG